MNTRKIFVRILCVILAFLMISGFIMMVIPVRAVSQSDIQALQEKRVALEQQLADQAEVVQALTDNHALIVERKAALDRQITLNRESIALLEQELAAYDDLIACGSMAAAKEKGLVRSEGKEYVMKDGDVVLFRFNV